MPQVTHHGLTSGWSTIFKLYPQLNTSSWNIVLDAFLWSQPTAKTPWRLLGLFQHISSDCSMTGRTKGLNKEMNSMETRSNGSPAMSKMCWCLRRPFHFLKTFRAYHFAWSSVMHTVSKSVIFTNQIFVSAHNPCSYHVRGRSQGLHKREKFLVTIIETFTLFNSY